MTMDQSAERRDSFRLPFATKVTCYVETTEKKYCGTLRDMSIEGFFMETIDCPHVGYKCNVEIILEGKHSRLRIEKLRGSIIRNNDEGMAVRFDERLEWMNDWDGLPTHLSFSINFVKSLLK